MSLLLAKNVQARGNNLSGIDRILSMPRARVYYPAGNPSYGAGNSFLPMSTVIYDTDGMASTPPYLTCQTAGVYMVSGRVQLGPSAAGNVGVWLRLINPFQTIVYAETTQWAKPDSIGCYIATAGLWMAQKGDQLGLWLSTSATVSLAGTTNGNSLEACMISAP